MPPSDIVNRLLEAEEPKSFLHRFSNEQRSRLPALTTALIENGFSPIKSLSPSPRTLTNFKLRNNDLAFVIHIRWSEERYAYQAFLAIARKLHVDEYGQCIWQHFNCDASWLLEPSETETEWAERVKGDLLDVTGPDKLEREERDFDHEDD